ncbi:MAG: hypothetical protein ABW321_09770 [Polyangiales bacterium]
MLTQPYQRLLVALVQLLTKPRAPRYIVLVALVLVLPGMGSRLLMDDFVLAVKAAPETVLPSLPSEPLGLFTFTTGDPARNGALMDEAALLPWWTEPRHLNAFFRPVAAATHTLDFRLWPTSSALMHLHSVLWYGVLLAALFWVYRTLEPSLLVASFSLFLYAIDDAHGATVGWVSNRNALLSAALALPALRAHHRAIAQGVGRERVLGPLWFVLGLGAGETAICVLGYLAAYAACLDRRPLVRRVVSLAPYVLILIVHQALYRVLGLGSYGSSGYRHPLNEPLAFLGMLGFNLPVLLSAELFVPIADLAFWGDVRARWYLWTFAVLSLAAVAWLLRSVLRGDRQAGFWALGMLLSAVPVSASLPGERLLTAVGFGAAPLLARFFAAAVGGHDPTRSTAVTPPPLREPWRGLGGVLFILHLVVAPLALPVRAYAMEPLGRIMDRIDTSLPRTAAVREQLVVVLNTPLNIMLSYQQIARAARGVPRPAHLYWLSSASSDTEVERVAPDTLRVTQERGFLLRPEETHYRANVDDLPTGTRLERAGMHIEVASSMPDGRPRSVLFRFDEPLESGHYLFRVYREGELKPWRPIPLGERIHLESQDFFRIMLLEALK